MRHLLFFQILLRISDGTSATIITVKCICAVRERSVNGQSVCNQNQKICLFSQCVSDSTKIPLETLRMIENTSEMEQWVQPMDNSGPLLFNHHIYTHIYVDSSQQKRNNLHPVLFLALSE